MSKGKGSAFEREICKRLGRWWTGGKRDDVFWRSTTSGARATSRGKKGQRTFGQYGDVQATDPIGQSLLDICTIEIKRGYKDATVGDKIDSPLNAIVRTWESFVIQAISQAAEASTMWWMLISKRDRREAMVTMPRRMYHYLAHRVDMSKSIPYVMSRIHVRSTRGSVKISGLEWIFITTLDQFLSRVPPRIMSLEEYMRWQKKTGL